MATIPTRFEEVVLFAKFRRRVTYANVMATVAVFIALGGSSYAVVKFGSANIINSSIRSEDIGSGQVHSSDILNNDVLGIDVRDGTIKTADVADHSLLAKDFALGQLPAGAQGAQGPQGLQGFPGQPGAQGPAGPLPDTLPSTKTLRGVYASGTTNENTTAGDIISDSISFPFPLASAPTAQVVLAGTAPPNCPGTVSDPQAAPGFLCVYVGTNAGVSGPNVLGTDENPGTSRFGVVIRATGTSTSASANLLSVGTWAVTAP
jgi:hypothetical protein